MGVAPRGSMVCWQMLTKRGTNGSAYKAEQRGKGMDIERRVVVSSLSVYSRPEAVSVGCLSRAVPWGNGRLALFNEARRM
jgi:hypothetical protein